MRREIISNSKDVESPSSDVLTSIIGSNLVGVNRERPAPPPNDAPKLSNEERLELWKHKARVFVPESYYYM